MKRFKLGILAIPLAIFLLFGSQVYADTAYPDSRPAIESINIYRNSVESGDMLLMVYVNIPYTVPPETPVTQTYIWSLVDTDNVTVFGSTIGNNYNADGYGYNVYSMYFSAATVTTLGIVWGTSYILRLSGNPAVFDTPRTYNYPLNIANYSALTVQADVQAELAARVLTIAEDLNNKWALPFSLLTQNETATVLSSIGEAFFRGAIHGLQAMAPLAFSVVIRVIDIEYRDWDPEYSENVTGQWSGTWVETAQEAGKVLFGTDYDLLSIIMLVGMCGGLMIGNIILTGDSWNGLVDCSFLGIIGARLGMFDLAFLMLVAAMCWMYISAKIWFGMIK